MIGYLYFIFIKKELVYIGATKNIFKRMQFHLCYASFDNLRVIECDLVKLKEYEKRLIQFFKPICNTIHHKPEKRHILYWMKSNNRPKRIWEYKAMLKYIPKNGYIARRLEREKKMKDLV